MTINTYEDAMIDMQAYGPDEWPDDDDDMPAHDPAAERTDEYLSGLDAAELYAPESLYNPRIYSMWWRGLMSFQEYQAHQAKMEALRAAYHDWVNRAAQRILDEMGW